jgi:hypothetical protein
MNFRLLLLLAGLGCFAASAAPRAPGSDQPEPDKDMAQVGMAHMERPHALPDAVLPTDQEIEPLPVFAPDSDAGVCSDPIPSLSDSGLCSWSS